MRLIIERVKRPVDECQCDWCGAPVYVGDRVYWFQESGAAFCSRACAQHDTCDRSYGPVCPGASYHTSDED